MPKNFIPLVCLTCLLLACLHVSAFAQSASPTAPNASHSPDGQDQESHSGNSNSKDNLTTWQTMVEGIQNDIKLRDNSVQRIKNKLPERHDELLHGLTKAGNRLDQLTLLHGVSGSTPWAYRTILIQLDSLRDYVHLKMSPLLEDKAKLTQIKEDYRAIRSIRLRQKASDLKEIMVSPSMANATAGYRVLKHNVKKLKLNIDDDLEKADALLAAIAEDHNATCRIYAAIFKRFYFTPTSGLLTRQGMSEAFEQTLQWADNMPRFWYPLFNWVEWDNFIVYFALCAFGLWATGAWILQRIRERLQAASGRHIARRGGWVLISLGLGLLISMHLTYFTGNQATILLWVDLIALGLIILTNSIVKSASGMAFSPPLRSPLILLFALMLLGDVLNILIVPAVCLNLIWLPALFFALVRMRRIGATNDIPLDRALARTSVPAIALLLVLAASGYGAGSLLLTQLWFMGLLTFMLCAMLRKFFQARQASPQSDEDTEGQTGEKALRPAGRSRASSNILDLTYPLTVTLIIYLFMAWALIFAGGTGFAQLVLRQQITLGDVSLTPRALILVLILFFLTRMVIHCMISFFEDLPKHGSKFNPALAHTLGTTVSYVFWVLYLLVSLHILGVSLSALTWIASGLSVGIGFGMKDLVNNFVSGLIILFGGSIKKGDVIQHKTMIGEVTDVSVRNTTIRTMDNTMVIIPNSSFLKGDISNFSYGDTTIRVTVPVTVIPGTKRKKVVKHMLKTAKKHERVLKDPAPQVLFKGFGQLGLDYHLYVWVGHFQDMYTVQSDLSDELDAVFKDNKIQVAFRTVKTKYKVKKKQENTGEVLRAKRKELYKLVNEKKRALNRQLRGASPDA